MAHKFVCLPGDGIGPEVMLQANRVLMALGIGFEEQPFGGVAIDSFGKALPVLVRGRYLAAGDLPAARSVLRAAAYTSPAVRGQDGRTEYRASIRGRAGESRAAEDVAVRVDDCRPESVDQREDDVTVVVSVVTIVALAWLIFRRSRR